MQWVNPKEKGGSLLKNIFHIGYFKNFSDKKLLEAVYHVLQDSCSAKEIGRIPSKKSRVKNFFK